MKLSTFKNSALLADSLFITHASSFVLQTAEKNSDLRNPDLIAGVAAAVMCRTCLEANALI